MANLLDKLPPVHAAFVREYVSNGYNGTNAYLKVKPNVGYDSASVTSTRLLSDDRIREAINSLQAKAFDKAIASRQYLIQQAHEIGEEARSKGQFNPALTSVDLKAKLNKLYERDTPDLESYATIMNQFVQVNISTQSPDNPPDTSTVIDTVGHITDPE